MEYSGAKHRLLAAHSLLLEPAGSFLKFDALKDIASGITPELDEALGIAERELHALMQVLGPHFVLLGTENLPETTEEQKKRKKAIISFWHIWDELRNEIERVHMQLDAAGSSEGARQRSLSWVRITKGAAVPLGLVVILAILFGMSAQTSVAITIKNDNCPTMVPHAPSLANYIPGISFPTAPMPAGSTAVAHMPTIPMIVEDLGNGTLKFNSLILHMTFQFTDLKSVQFDNMELLGHITDLQLAKLKMHYLEFTCK